MRDHSINGVRDHLDQLLRCRRLFENLSIADSARPGDQRVRVIAGDHNGWRGVVARAHTAHELQSVQARHLVVDQQAIAAELVRRIRERTGTI